MRLIKFIICMLTSHKGDLRGGGVHHCPSCGIVWSYLGDK